MSGTVRILLAIASVAVLVLVSLLASSSAWLWLLFGATLVLYFHSRTALYPLLVVGAVMAGASVGVLLEVALRWSGAFLVSVGAAGLVVEAIEERPGHWTFIIGLALIVLGMLVGIFDAGWRTVLAASTVAVAAAVWYLAGQRRAT